MLVRADHPDFWPLYERLAQEQAWLSPIHGKISLAYYSQLSRDQGEQAEDRSYLVLHENRPVAAFIGALVGKEKKNLLAYQVPCISIENAELLRANAARDYIREFDDILSSVDGQLRYRDFLLGGKMSSLSRHLLSRGAAAETIFHRVIDLSEEESVLKRNLRKSYGSLVNWGLRELQPEVITHGRLTWEQMDAFRKLHIREAGRETRSESSWRKLYEWVKAGSAFIVLGHWNGELVSAGMFETSRTNCIYGVSASRRDLFEKPLFHGLMWVAMLHAKRLGCRWFEVGRQVFPRFPLDCPPSTKELGISEFKAGFGGVTQLMMDLSLKDPRGPAAQAQTAAQAE